jgi:hypothetical protein
VLVEYGPGGYSPGHTHPKSAFIYATVLEGAIRSQVNDGPVTTYKAGQSFSELPGDRHGVSANASKTKPAKLLAVFVVDTNETELTIPFGDRGHSHSVKCSSSRRYDFQYARALRLGYLIVAFSPASLSAAWASRSNMRRGAPE